MYITIFGIQSINKEINNDINPSENIIFVDFEIENREADAIITVLVEHRGYTPTQKKNFFMSSKTGFQISNADLSFLEHPLNPQTVDLCVELAQTAIAHNRTFALPITQINEDGVIIPHYIQHEELIEKVRHSLSAKLN